VAAGAWARRLWLDDFGYRDRHRPQSTTQQCDRHCLLRQCCELGGVSMLVPAGELGNMSAMSVLRLLLLLSTLSMAMSSSGNHPRLPQMVQLCLHDEKEVDQLIGLLEQAASENGLKFVNRSAANQLELSRLKKDPGYRVISISASRPDGLGLAAGNLSLGAYEMAIGFTHGANAEESAAFIRGVMNLLNSKWVVRPVAEGQGAMKSTDCGVK